MKLFDERFWAAGLGMLALSAAARNSPRTEASGRSHGPAHARIGQEVRWVRTPEERAISERRIRELLAQPLSVEDAVQIALLGNPSLQAAFQELGISEADLVQSGRLPNPGFTFRHAASGGVYDIEETLSVNVLGAADPAVCASSRAAAIRGGAERGDARDRAAGRSARAMRTTRRSRRTNRSATASKSSGGRGGRGARAPHACRRQLEPARRGSRSGLLPGCSLNSERRPARAHRGVARDLAQLLALEIRGGRLSASPIGCPLCPPQRSRCDPISMRAASTGASTLQMLRARIDALAATPAAHQGDAARQRARRGTDPRPTGRPVREALRTRLSKSPWRCRFSTAAAPRPESRGPLRPRRSTASRRRPSMPARRCGRHTPPTAPRFDMAIQQRDEVVPLRQSSREQNLLRYNASLISIFELLADAGAQIAAVDDYIQASAISGSPNRNSTRPARLPLRH